MIFYAQLGLIVLICALPAAMVAIALVSWIQGEIEEHCRRREE